MDEERGWLKSDVLSEDESRRTSASALGVPFVVLSRDNISKEALELIPEPLSRTHQVVAYALGEHGVEVALLDVTDLANIEFVFAGGNMGAPIKIIPRLTDRDSIKRALLIYQKHLKEKFAGLAERGIEAADSLIKHAIHSGASHIHLEPAAAGMLVRYRIGKVLHEAMRLPTEVGASITQRLKSLAKLFPLSTVAQEGRFKTQHAGETIAVRVSTLPTTSGEKFFLRLARTNAGQTGFTLESLGFHGEGLEHLHAILNDRSGLMVVCGPKESGKTTTLYTLLDLLQLPHLSIATVEEKIAYRLPAVSQTQVRPDIGLSMAGAIRAVLKGDPDVVMISAIDSFEVATLAASAAKRGLFVLAGMECDSPEEVLSMLGEYMPGAILNQRLIKKLCLTCREAHRPSRQELDLLEERADFGRVLGALKAEELVTTDAAWKDITWYRPVGCDHCDGGYSGRLGVQEIIDGTGLTLFEDALFKAAAGLTSIEEVVYLAQ